MKADVGDRLVTDGPGGQRDCLIIGLQHADGSPPYVVRWLADGHIALVSPGPYTKLARGAKALQAEGKRANGVRGRGLRGSDQGTSTDMP